MIADSTSKTIRSLLREAVTALMGHSGSPRLDVELLLGHVLEKSREYLIAHDDQALTLRQIGTFEKLLTLRLKGMPLPYLLGKRSFYDRDFKVNSHVLIPRPETESIVEAAIVWARHTYDGKARIVDVGTGSGAIAVSVGAHLPQSTVIATDISLAALRIAQENSDGLANIRFVQADLLTPFGGQFEVICANMPYIAAPDLSLLEVAKFEPHVALDGGADGLRLIRRLIAQLPLRLAVPGLALLEMACDQGEAALALANQALPQARLSILKDYAGLDRHLKIELG
ncbi:Release factor glutamine methyltransferase [Anaerolineae bacterium]|nr:Release factor glutamine methyltransferase [Anaerolineae bacterium]